MLLGSEVDFVGAWIGQLALTHVAPHWSRLALSGVLWGVLEGHDARGGGGEMGVERNGPIISSGRVTWLVKLYGNVFIALL